MGINELDAENPQLLPQAEVTDTTQAGLVENINTEGKIYKGKISSIGHNHIISVFDDSGEHIFLKDVTMGEVKFSEGDVIEYTIETNSPGEYLCMTVTKARPLSLEEKSEEENQRIQGILDQVQQEITADRQLWSGLKEDRFPILEEYFAKHTEDNDFGITSQKLKEMKEKIYVIQAKQRLIEVKENLTTGKNRHQTQENISYLSYFIDTHGEEVVLGITRQNIDEMNIKNKNAFLHVAQIGEITQRYADADKRKEKDEKLEQNMKTTNNMEEAMMMLHAAFGRDGLSRQESMEEEESMEEIVIQSETDTFSMRLFDMDFREINCKIGDKVHFVLDRKNSPKGEVQISINNEDILLVGLNKIE